jgi:hypothetical protein
MLETLLRSVEILLDYPIDKYTMRPESYQIFAQLCEAFVNEDSTAMKLIVGKPGGQEVVKKLHKDMKLAHDLGYSPIDKISWSELKDARNGAWVIVQADRGSGAIRAINDRYEALASMGGEVKEFKDGKGGNILDFFKNEIGKPRKFFVAKNTRAVSDKQTTRADNKKGAGAPEVTQGTLIRKFKPLWVRAITASIADIKGHVANQIKNDAFEKAKKKLEYISRLQSGLEMLEAGEVGGGDIPDFLNNAINAAVLMTASHYYPETTGNLERTRWGSGGLQAQFPEGPATLLKDIASGDTAKMGTVLSFFKRSLVSG